MHGGIGGFPRPLVAVDLQQVSEVGDAVTSFGQRYLDRVYTPAEQADAGGRADSLAARFAAKEAVIKLLDTDAAIDTREIEVRRTATGRPVVTLHGQVARLAGAAGLGPVDVSLSHSAGFALAAAVTTVIPPTAAGGNP